jgi:hypothetical protein
LAQVALRVPVFLASSGDVVDERNAIDAILQRLSDKYAARRILVDLIRWERDGSPGWGRPQDLLNPLVRESELIIVVLWARLGNGVQEELRLAEELMAIGASDDLFVYFRTTPPKAGAAGLSEMQEFKRSLQNSSRIFVWDYETPEHLAELVSSHVGTWLDMWPQALEACEFALKYSPAFAPAEGGEDRILQLKRATARWPSDGELHALGSVAVRHYQANGAHGANMPLAPETMQPVYLFKDLHGSAPESGREFPLLRTSRSAPLPLSSTADGDTYFSTPEWFFFCSAWGLTNAIVERQTTPVERLEYCNDVHQFLSELLAEQSPARSPATESLILWLAGGGGAAGKPIVRNFAAYVLGMIGAQPAAATLASAAQNDRGQGVRLYSLLALGKLRARRYLPLLLKEYAGERDPRLRLIFAQAIARTIGVVPYDL